MRIRPPSLATLLAFAMGGVTLVLAVTLSLVISHFASREMKDATGRRLAKLSAEMRDRLEHEMYERQQDLQVAATLPLFVHGRGTDANRRALLERLQGTTADYTWIGFADASGIVQVAAEGVLEGEDVTGRSWFQEALVAPTVQDVQDASELAPLLASHLGAPVRLMSLATPVRTPDGVQVGVLAAHMSWSWAKEVARSVVSSVTDEGLELFILSRDGVVLLGPPALEGRKLELASVEAARRFRPGAVAERWPDGRDYLTGGSLGEGFRAYPGLGWVVLARQELSAAYAPARKLQLHILLWSAVLGAGFTGLSLYAARRIARPLWNISRAAVRIRLGEVNVEMPLVDDYAEARVLSRSLRTLLQAMTRQEAELAESNALLEQKVNERTREIRASHQRLQEEMKRRLEMEADRERLIIQLQELADTDPLTGALNRRSFSVRGEYELARARRNGSSVAVVMVDIDHFKHVNDNYGHAVGDAVIRSIVQVCKEQVREVDLVARFGGEEFVILLSDITRPDAKDVAERLRLAVAGTVIETGQGPLRVSASLGVALSRGHEVEIEPLLESADEALYNAKRSGRNRVVVAPNGPPGGDSHPRKEHGHVAAA